VLYFTFRPSRYLAAILIVVHGGAGLALLLVPASLWLTFPAMCLLLLSLAYHLRRHAWLRTSASCVALRFEAEGVQLVMGDGAQLEGAISPDTFVTPMLTIINVLVPAQRARRSIVILPDSMDREVFRQLRVLLRWGHPPG
jgi:toxin CptA